MRRNHSNHIPSLIYLIPVTTRDESLSRAQSTLLHVQQQPPKNHPRSERKRSEEARCTSERERRWLSQFARVIRFPGTRFFRNDAPLHSLGALHSLPPLYSTLFLSLIFSLSFFVALLYKCLARFISSPFRVAFAGTAFSSSLRLLESHYSERKREKERVREDDPL